MPVPPATAPFSPLQVSAGAFVGTLDALAQALRSGQVRPDEVPLLHITRELIARSEELSADDRAEALPPLASVIALKARLLLPQRQTVTDDGDGDSGGFADDGLSDLLEGVEALAELDTLVSFLSRRRAERSGLIAPRPLPLNLPRKQRPAAGKAGLARLVKAAQHAVREVAPPLLARERLTLADALGALRAFGLRLRHFTLLSVPISDWAERTTYFAALLEGVKEGLLSAEQATPFADIHIATLEHEAKGDTRATGDTGDTRSDLNLS